MSEALYVGEEDLEEVIKIIRTGIKKSDHVSRTVKRNLELWCTDMENYIRELQQDAELENEDEDEKPKKRKKSSR